MKRATFKLLAYMTTADGGKLHYLDPDDMKRLATTAYYIDN